MVQESEEVQRQLILSSSSLERHINTIALSTSFIRLRFHIESRYCCGFEIPARMSYAKSRTSINLGFVAGAQFLSEEGVQSFLKVLLSTGMH